MSDLCSIFYCLVLEKMLYRYNVAHVAAFLSMSCHEARVFFEEGMVVPYLRVRRGIQVPSLRVYPGRHEYATHLPR